MKHIRWFLIVEVALGRGVLGEGGYGGGQGHSRDWSCNTDNLSVCCSATVTVTMYFVNLIPNSYITNPLDLTMNIAM